MADAEKTKRVCQNPDCEDSRALPMFDEQGRHNFAPHILNGEQIVVCLPCKMSLLALKKRQ